MAPAPNYKPTPADFDYESTNAAEHLAGVIKLQERIARLEALLGAAIPWIETNVKVLKDCTAYFEEKR